MPYAARFAAVAVLGIFSVGGFGAEVRFKNNLKEPYTLLFRTGGKPEDWPPPLELPRLRSVRFELHAAGKYHLFLQDQAKRKRDLGWVNLHAIARADPKAELLLSEVLMKLTEECK